MLTFSIQDGGGIFDYCFYFQVVFLLPVYKNKQYYRSCLFSNTADIRHTDYLIVQVFLAIFAHSIAMEYKPQSALSSTEALLIYFLIW